MGAAEVIETLQGLGVSVRADGSKLLLEPGSRVPAELMPEIRRYKQEILELLAASACDEPTAALLAWAAQAAEAGLVLSKPVQFLETPLRPYATRDVGRYCRERLRFLVLARSNRATGGWGQFTPEWWQRMEEESLQALAALKAATEAAGDRE